jgi:hypothetical protein
VAIWPSIISHEQYLTKSISIFIYFACGLFNNAVSSKDYIALYDMIINWKECGKK